MSIAFPTQDMKAALAPGEILTITPSADFISGTLFRLGSTAAPRPIRPGLPMRIGPFPTSREFNVSVAGGTVDLAVIPRQHFYSSFMGILEGFTGNLTLTNDDVGKIFRCEDSSNVTVTVPANLLDGFNVGLAQWGAGTVTIAAGSGATKRSTESAVSAQYKTAAIVVIKNAGGAAAEFVLSGSIT